MSATPLPDGPAPLTQRDGPGHPFDGLHLWGATLGIALQPISTATGNIGFVLALCCMLPRLSQAQVRQALADLAGRAWARLLVAWIGWSLLSLAWSPDPIFGLEQFKAVRVLLWIPVLWPIRHRWRHLVGGLLAGTAVMGLLQATQVETGWPRSKGPIGSGLTTPTQTGLWAAVSLTFWLILSVSVRPRVAVATLPLMMLSGVGVAWSATRASVVGLAIEFVVANIVLALTSRGWLARAALRCLLGLMILAAATTFAGSYLQSKMSRAIHAIQSDEAVAPERRIAMWTAAVEGWSRSPVAGVGIGGIPSIMERAPVTSARDPLRRVRMIHSTYLQVLTETGVVGACLLLGFIVLLFRDVLRALKDQSLLIAGFGSLIVWFIAAAFDGYQQSGGLLTVGAILIPLALADLRPRDATACPDADATRGRTTEANPTSG